MEREISGGAMLGIVLLALAAVIGLGFGVFVITKSVANEGVNGVTDEITSLNSRYFDDYNQKLVTAGSVLSSLQTLKGKPYAVLVSTKAFREGQPIASADVRKGSSAFLLESSNVIAGEKITFINYNALFETESGTDNAIRQGEGLLSGVQTIDKLDFESGYYVSKYGFQLTNDGGLDYALTLGGLYVTNNSEYLGQNTKYTSNLIKDESGVVIGIAFRQM